MDQRATPVTLVIAGRVKALREDARLSGAALAERLREHGLTWNRSTVIKLENGARESVTVQELLALALVLDVPPMMLIADPRYVDAVPVAKDLTASTWDALLWLSGSGRIEASGLSNYTSAAWLIQAGWAIVANVTELQKHDDMYDSGDPEQARLAQQRDEDRHRGALRQIRTAIHRIQRAGAPLPPMFPTEFVYQRAAELGVDMPTVDD